MEYIAQFDYKTYADTPELARLKSGFLLKEMLEHFSQKINSTLQPNRSLWIYSAHDITILNMLNSLGLFEVCFNINTISDNRFLISYEIIKIQRFVPNFISSCIFLRMELQFILNFTKTATVNTMCKCFTEIRKKNIRYL